MTTTTQIDLKINKLTQAQYNGATINPQELYMVTDGVILSSDVTAALGYTPYDSSNPSGYTSNIGTVTSVNNTSPDGSGNVSISVGDTLPSQTGQVGKYLTTDGSSTSWATPPGGTALGDIYPVGAIYITTAATCPLASLISGSTWTLVSSGMVLQGADANHAAGTTISAGLPNITGTFVPKGNGPCYMDVDSSATGALKMSTTTANAKTFSGTSTNHTAVTGGVAFNASLSNNIYGGSSTVQPPAFVVNIFERTA